MIREAIIVLFCAVSPIAFLLGAEPEFAGKVEARECRARLGAGHVMGKIRAGRPVKIAYFGGSITEMDGWRRLSREWLQGQYPGCSFSEIQAAIGGTGSRMGVYRFAQDVLDKDPDLVFVEFATNDASLRPADIWRNFDGFVRQAWRRNPEIDIVFVYTITKPMVGDYAQGLCPVAASAMEQLADYYGIPSICFGPRVAADVAKGTLVMSMGEVETAVPADTPDRDAAIDAELAKEGKMLFSKDGVHPALPGHTRYYLESVKAAWPGIAAVAGVPDHASTLAAPFSTDAMEMAKLAAVSPSMLTGDWRQLEAGDENGNFNGRFGAAAWLAQTPGAKLRFRFRGSECLVYDIVGPACGQVWVCVDGIRRAAPVARFDSYCTYYRTTALEVYSGTNGLHEVELVLDEEQPSRASLKASGVTDEELAGDKYNGTRWYAGRLMVAGQIVGDDRAAWFDARIPRYERWPQDAAFALHGAWSRTDAMTLAAKGVVEMSAAESPVSFDADRRKSLGADATSVILDSEMTFYAHSASEIPPVDASQKAGVILVDEGDELRYYGLCDMGGSNAWARLSGVEPSPPGASVRLRIRVVRRGASRHVVYSVNGVDCTRNGVAEIPVSVGDGMFRGVLFHGFTEVTELAATAISPLGLSMRLL